MDKTIPFRTHFPIQNYKLFGENITGSEKNIWQYNTSTQSFTLANTTQYGEVRQGADGKMYIPGQGNDNNLTTIIDNTTLAIGSDAEVFGAGIDIGYGLSGNIPAQPLQIIDASGSRDVFSRNAGKKSYEIKTHLGDAAVIVSDRLGAEDLGGGIIANYAIVSSYNSYYPFGMQQPGRTYNTGDYRFGFNGQEKTDEISGSGNHYTTTFWEYDSRTGRRWENDPVVFPWQSPYAAFNNNPIYFIDPDGREGIGNWLKNAWKNIKNVFSGEKIGFESGRGTPKNPIQGPIVNIVAERGTPAASRGGFFSSVFSAIKNWWGSSERFFRAEGKIDVGPQAGISIEAGTGRAEADVTLMNVTLIGGSVEQRGKDYNPYEFEFDYPGKEGYIDIEQQVGISVPFVAGAKYEHSFEGRLSGGYRNERHTATVNAAIIEGQVKRNTTNRQTKVQTGFTVGGRISVGIGIEVSATFGVKEK
ncbi:MAG: hypothetical protein HYY40_04295 [Bacteroidetes bacterium]|nr:hypothetical protein [Bacteroidota bacterium]